MLPNKTILSVYRLAYSLFRFSENIRQKTLKEKFQNYSILIIENSYSGNIVELKLNLSSLKGIISFSSDIGFLDYKNKGILVEFIEKIEEEILGIKELKNSLKEDLEKDFNLLNKKEVIENSLEEIDNINKFSFSNKEKENSLNFEGILESAKNSSENSSEFGSVLVRKSSSENNSSESNSKKDKTNERREKIVNKIKQNGICFIKDLSDLFPEHSDRTIRYDLEWLAKNGRVEKIGSSGPGTFYRSIG